VTIIMTHIGSNRERAGFLSGAVIPHWGLWSFGIINRECHHTISYCEESGDCVILGSRSFDILFAMLP
jgi:hypothetical protein